MENRGRRIHAIEKALRLLDCFWLERRPLSLSELEKMTGWAKSTIHGLLASMLDSGVVEQNASDGRYRLGYHLFELGNAVNQSWEPADADDAGFLHAEHRHRCRRAAAIACRHPAAGQRRGAGGI